MVLEDAMQIGGEYMKKLIGRLIKFGPIIYPIVLKMVRNRKSKKITR